MHHIFTAHTIQHIEMQPSKFLHSLSLFPSHAVQCCSAGGDGKGHSISVANAIGERRCTCATHSSATKVHKFAAFFMHE